MTTSKAKTRNASPGIAYVMALLLLVILTTLAVAFAATTNLNVRKSDNNQKAQAALLTAESGLHYMVMTLRGVRLPENTTAETFLANLADSLGLKLDGTGNLPGQGVSNTGTAVYVPSIAIPHGAFVSYLTRTDAGNCRLEVVGTAGGLSRRVSMEFELQIRRPAVFDYGLASKGQISIFGNASIVSVNDPSDASVLSATVSHADAIIIDGNTTISGDLHAAGADSYVSISGTPEIAGSTDPEVYADNIHIGVEVPDFPAVDTDPFLALATGDIIDSSFDFSQSGLVLNNLLIKAGTNPTFSNDITINGVVYIEAPNVVKFTGNTTMNGVIATEGSDEPIENCKLTFSGGVTVGSVEDLPEEFAAVKQLSGTFIVAPGFDVTFSGHFSAINGCIAADKLTFTGSAEGTVQGSVIGLRDLPTSVGGTVNIFVDRENANQNPAGFLNSFALVAVPETYTEHKGG